jgi:osmoprotectant transport system permease protein
MTTARYLFLLGVCTSLGCKHREVVVVGSKKFTESVLLGETVAALLRGAGFGVRHRAELGGTRLLWRALLKREVDVYPEYTGTLCQEVVRSTCDQKSLRRALAIYGVEMTRSLGFHDSYALASRADQARHLQLSKISDLAHQPAIRLGLSDEFFGREDGWSALRARYHFRPMEVRVLDHDLAYRGLQSGALDVIDVYTTDPELSSSPRQRALQILEDDRHFFRDYDAVLLFRADLNPEAKALLLQLEGQISQSEMIELNRRAKIEEEPASVLATEFLKVHRFAAGAAQEEGRWIRLRRRTKEHLLLVMCSLWAATLFGLPLGILAARRPALRQLVLGFSGLVQTVPSLALLVFMIPIFGIGLAPALVALFVYSLLPIVRGTVTGLDGITPPLRESAAAIGLTAWEQLRLVELPLAAFSILAGIQTAAVLAVGTATLGALIGAGGYGEPILTGIRLDKTSLILEGAIPAAAMALLAQLFFEVLGRVMVPRGLR